MLQQVEISSSSSRPAIAGGGETHVGATTWSGGIDVGAVTLSGGSERRGSDYMHARHYKPLLGRFLSPDKLSGKTREPQSWNRYAYSLGNPLVYIDPDGRDAIAFVFPNYRIATPIGRLPGLGHAGIVTIDKRGGTRYYEYGRYDSAGIGLVRRQSVPNVQMGANGLPTKASLEGLLRAVSDKAGKGGTVEGAYFINDKAAAMNEYAEGRKDQNSDPSRTPYSITGNNCGTFCKDTLEAGGVDTPLMLDPRPNSYIDELQQSDAFSLSFDPAKGLTVDCKASSDGKSGCPK